MNLPKAVFFSLLCVVSANESLEMLDHPSMSPSRMERVRQFLATLNAKAVADLPHVNENRQPHASKRTRQPIIANIEGTEVNIEQTPSIADLNDEMAPYLYEGDIVLTDQQIQLMEGRTGENETRQRRSAAVNRAKKWDVYKPIPYRLHSNLGVRNQRAAKRAIDKITRKTCLSFVEDPSSTYGLDFYLGDGCNSHIGQMVNQNNQPEWQRISLGLGCGTTTLGVHEISHSLGIGHTQTRADRDQYVTLNLGNVKANYEHNFDKLKEKDNDNPVPYDYGSVMHYGPKDFARDERVLVLSPFDHQYIRTMNRHKEAVAFSDWKALCSFYNCTRWCEPSMVQCQNGGYVNPRDCYSCECPDYFSGTTCENVVEPVRVDNKKLFEYRKERADARLAGSYIEFDDYEKSKPSVVTGPEGSKLRVTFSGYSSSLQKCEEDCTVLGAEIADEDLTLVGKTFCCQEDVGLNFVSKSNKVGVKFYSKPGIVVSLNVTVEVA